MVQEYQAWILLALLFDPCQHNCSWQFGYSAYKWPPVPVFAKEYIHCRGRLLCLEDDLAIRMLSINSRTCSCQETSDAPLYPALN